MTSTKSAPGDAGDTLTLDIATRPAEETCVLDPEVFANSGDDSADEEMRKALRAGARSVAQAVVADAVTSALKRYDGSLRDLYGAGGPDPALVSKLSRGLRKNGGSVALLAQIALAMDKRLRISIE